MSTGTDADAIRHSLTDPEAFAAVFDRHAPDVFAFLARRLGRSGAEGLLGEVFRIAFERRGSFDLDHPSARPWLFGIAANLVSKERRRQGRGAAAMERLAMRRDVPEAPFERADDVLDAGGDLARVARAVDHLDDDERDVLLLFAWEELSYAEIAAALAVPVGTVRSRLHRARSALRELLGADGEVPVDNSTSGRPGRWRS